MAVVINDVDVMTEPAASGAPPAQGSPGRTPPDMVRIALELRRERDRRERRWAD